MTIYFQVPVTWNKMTGNCDMGKHPRSQLPGKIQKNLAKPAMEKNDDFCYTVAILLSRYKNPVYA